MAAYEIHVPDSQLSQLQQKLENATFPDELSGANWDYGAPLSEIKRLAAHWTTSYDWRAQETKLNTLPQYHRSIKVDNFEPLDIHYIHQTSPAPNAIPLLFVHGWPGSYLEVLKILPSSRRLCPISAGARVPTAVDLRCASMLRRATA
jgi:hypothetical protein